MEINERPISEQSNIIRNTLLVGPVETISSKTFENVSSLVVIAICDCGCGSIEFSLSERTEIVLADAVTKDRAFNIIVWGKGDQITYLEILDYNESKTLPQPESICSWEEAGKYML